MQRPLVCYCVEMPVRRPAPHSAIKDLHRTTAEELGVDAETREEVETLLTQLQQLLVGISIMQAIRRGWTSFTGLRRVLVSGCSRLWAIAGWLAALCCSKSAMSRAVQDLTNRAKDSLVSFGERLSTRLFAAYLNAQGVPARQYDAFDIGVITNDNFVNAEVRRRCGLMLLGSAHYGAPCRPFDPSMACFGLPAGQL